MGGQALEQMRMETIKVQIRDRMSWQHRWQHMMPVCYAASVSATAHTSGCTGTEIT